jgi:8-oxo-dGTP diphosphatase
MPSFIDKLAWIHLKDKQVLGTRSKGKDTYYIPGGKREKDESDLQALEREITEELNVQLIPDTVRFVGKFEAQAHGKPEGTLVRMSCYTGDYEGILKASSEIEELCWLKFEDRGKTSPVDILILTWLKNQDLID